MEWEVTILELLDPLELVMREDADALSIRLSEQATELQLRDKDAQLLATVTVPHDVLNDFIAEYVDTVRQMARGDRVGLARLEALDMAKKVVHDKAGRRLKQQLRPFQIDHPTARRFFTLLLCLRVDTTRLTGVHGHRRFL